ncbi:hypothetical protein VST7929_03308 [Vibrio stylophorae]|uniref:DUF1330 domain-containing protein n=1 Tax=Vibrio stylophorae TaxID=659351 RepID=A0ABM8ZZ65_9VIBR|nr:DUF1330 domain-containing protein [Vibrio stylophorae]CAH0536290.1 hypothetical protein VST7929_03308 [Vibrio stylophorae]
MPTYYSVLEVTPTSDEWVEDYVAASHRLVHQHGGQYLARTNTHERLEGNRTNPTLRIIISWPSRQAAIDFMNDLEYIPHLQARIAGSESHHALIEGVDQLA